MYVRHCVVVLQLVHGDVFRPPRGFFGPMFLSVFVGSGVQLFMMMMAVMLFAVLGFLSPANRGGLLTAMLLLFVFMGSFGGYYAARLYKMFHGKAWKRNTVLTGIMYPGTIATIAFIVNFFVWGQVRSRGGGLRLERVICRSLGWRFLWLFATKRRTPSAHRVRCA